MVDKSFYKGEVTLTFYDKDNNIKNRVTTKNTGTPWLFYILTYLLKNGAVPHTWDWRP